MLGFKTGDWEMERAKDTTGEPTVDDMNPALPIIRTIP